MSIAEMRKKLAVMHDALKKYGIPCCTSNSSPSVLFISLAPVDTGADSGRSIEPGPDNNETIKLLNVLTSKYVGGITFCNLVINPFLVSGKKKVYQKMKVV